MGTASYAGHVATNGSDCASCHAKAVSGGYASWSGGTFAHKTTDTNCSSCHNGKTANGMTTPPHMPTGTLQCRNCHTNTAASFTTYTMNHASVVDDALRLLSQRRVHQPGHQGRAGHGVVCRATSRPGGSDCASCHAKAVSGGYATWSGGTFAHKATDTNCSSCHNGKTAQGMTTPPHLPTGTLQCSNCHTNTASSFTTYTMNHASVSTMRCDACHTGAYTSQGTKGAMGTASFSGHVATNGADCASCHARSVSGGYVTWTGGVFTHKATDTNCSSCHNGAAAKGMSTPPHIPVTGIQCSNCHVNTAASFTTYTMSHSAVHATRCDSCHNGSYTGQGKKGAEGPDHKAKSQDCGCCHTGAAVSFSTWDDDPKGSAGTCTTTAKSVTNPITAVRSAMQSVTNRTMTAVTSAINSVTGSNGGSAAQSSGSPAPGVATNNAAAPQSALAKGDKEAAGAPTATGTPPAAAASSGPSATIAANDSRSKLAPTIGPSTADQSLQPGARLTPAQQLGLSAAPAAGATSSSVRSHERARPLRIMPQR